MREPDRKESSGRGAVRDDLLIVAWQSFLFSWQNYTRLYFILFIMLLSETGGLPFFLNDQNK